VRKGREHSGDVDVNGRINNIKMYLKWRTGSDDVTGFA
jgi:hypothetical protein